MSDYRPTCVIRAPVDTRSGYGAMSRDIVRHIIEKDEYDVTVHSVRWGDTPQGVLDKNKEKDRMILDRIRVEQFHQQPDLYVSITIPPEFQPMGKFNIGITAGIECSIAAASWVDAMNRMDVNFVISEHSKAVFEMSRYSNNETGDVLAIQKPIEVLHNCVDTYTFQKTASYELEKTVREKLDEIKEDFNFLFVGHWLPGPMGHDRKNVGLLIKIFYELFKRVDYQDKPGLILKTNLSTFSIMDRVEVLKRINQIKETVELEDGEELPNIYLIHGDFTDEEMNSMYNHPKVKSHVTFTRGEGFGRPLLEASMTGKPIVASGWSGHMDFLNVKESILIGGELNKMHPDSKTADWFPDDATWFDPDQNMAASALNEVLINYKEWKKRGNRLAKKNREKFNYKEIQRKTWDLLDQYVPEFKPRPKKRNIVMPTDNNAGMELPELKKVKK